MCVCVCVTGFLPPMGGRMGTALFSAGGSSVSGSRPTSGPPPCSLHPSRWASLFLIVVLFSSGMSTHFGGSRIQSSVEKNKTKKSLCSAFQASLGQGHGGCGGGVESQASQPPGLWVSHTWADGHHTNGPVQEVLSQAPRLPQGPPPRLPPPFTAGLLHCPHHWLAQSLAQSHRLWLCPQHQSWSKPAPETCPSNRQPQQLAPSRAPVRVRVRAMGLGFNIQGHISVL